MGINMKVKYKFVSAVTLILAAMILSFQVSAAEIVGGGGNAAEKLILDWATAKPGNRANPVKFSSSIVSNDLAAVQSGKIDFAIVDAPLSEVDLARMKLLQFPFALGGVSIAKHHGRHPEAGWPHRG
jgi:ABC-type phosphate transport system substrate-binding protein